MHFIFQTIRKQQPQRPCTSTLPIIHFERMTSLHLPLNQISLLPSCRKYHLSNSRCTQQLGRIPSSNYFQIMLRMYVTTRGNSTFNRSERALMDELHRLSHRQENSQPTLGPFLMPRGKVDEKPLRTEELHHWSQVNWPERTRRVFRMSRNLVIVSFGGCLGLLVIYSITSELFAPSSTTNLMNMTITTLEESEKLKKILKSPFKFHTPTIASQNTQDHTGITELRFSVESYKPSHAIAGDWKSWITPLITSQVVHRSDSNHNQNQSPESNSNLTHDKLDQDLNGRQTNWWPGLFKFIMPNTFGNKSSHYSNNERSWSDRFFSNHGSFDHGEVIAELIKESNGQWKYKTLLVDFPNSHNLKYRLDISDELRLKRKSKQQQQNQDEGEHDTKKNQTRYRFWNRRINL